MTTIGARSSVWLAFGTNKIGLWPLVEQDDMVYIYDSEIGVIVDAVPNSGTWTFNSELGVVVDITTTGTETYSFDSEAGDAVDMEAEVGQYTLTYVQDVGPVTMAGDWDEPPIPLAYQEALVDYAAARCLLINARGPKIERALGFYQRFNELAEKARLATDNLGAEFAITPQAIVR